MTTLTYTGTLTVTSCWCGIHLAIPADLQDFAIRNKHTIYCPLGHEFVYGDTVREQLADANTRIEQLREQQESTRQLLEHEGRSHAATRGHLTRKRKQLDRVSAGVCPCCNRTFVNLGRHMQTRHPDFQEPR